LSSVIRLRGVSRRFGPVQALRDVDLDLEPGEIHALVGENGAGKSTLINILAGRVAPDAGAITVRGNARVFANRADSVGAGIGAVFQHFSLVGRFSVAENLQVGRPEVGHLIRLGEARNLIHEWADRVDAALDPDAKVDDLSVAQRQLAEFLIALVWGAEVLLLDEPTAVLSPLEGDRLLELVKGCARNDVAVLLVTHKLREVQAVADRVTVLRRGQVTGHHPAGAIPSTKTLVNQMMGDEAFPPPIRGHATERVRLVVDNLTVGRLRGIDLAVRAGEVVGLAGVAGSGQLDLVQAVAGLCTPASGHVIIDGADVTGAPARATRAGVAYIPEDRAVDGLAMNLSVAANAVAKDLRQVGSWRGIDRRAVTELAGRVVGHLGVQPATTTAAVRRLSGGNQQRLLVGRELVRKPTVVVAAEPTRGLDPGARAAVVASLRSAAARGAAVVVTSTDVDELVDLADRLLVLASGLITLDAPVSDLGREQIGQAMAGVA
jgi:ABC-type uncharacterized transport system ATPase subunit